MSTALDRPDTAAVESSPRTHRSGRPLTLREVEILELVSRGWTSVRIAREFGTTEMTVKSHLRRMLLKLGAANRAALVAAGFEVGVLEAPPLAPGGVRPPLDPLLAELLPLIAGGLSYIEIAGRVGRSPNAVKSRLRRLLKLLDVSSNAEAVRVAIEAQCLWLSPDGLWVSS